MEEDQRQMKWDFKGICNGLIKIAVGSQVASVDHVVAGRSPSGAGSAQGVQESSQSQEGMAHETIPQVSKGSWSLAGSHTVGKRQRHG